MSLELPQNYFELFQLPCAPSVDEHRLTDRYRALQRELHPDRFATAGARERRMAAAAAAHVNQAYRVLRDRHERAGYLLQLQQIDIDEERDTSSDTEFLMHQMELREQMEELQTASQVEQCDTQLESEEATLWDEFAGHYAKEDWEKVRDLTLKLRFYRRLRQKTKEMRAQISTK